MSGEKKILVAGDVCLDVVAVRMPPPVTSEEAENWRLAGETRTHFLLGGAMLLAEWMRAAVAGEGSYKVVGPRPVVPAAGGTNKDTPMDPPGFLRAATRLCRDDMVHSLLEAKHFPVKPDDKKNRTLRVERTAGYSGPEAQEPLLRIHYDAAESARVIVLDDTGNRFRQGTDRNPWPPAVAAPAAGADPGPWIVYKLNRPLPGNHANSLWDAVERNHPDRRLVIVSVDDLRKAGVPISQGLSWERTALDIAWQLANASELERLMECRLLIIRLDLDGAVIWRRGAADPKAPSTRGTDQAWLVYDPSGIEGGYAQSTLGGMVGAGSVFAAALAKAACTLDGLGEDAMISAVTDGIRAGLLAGRRLHKLGFGADALLPTYPLEPLFKPADAKDDARFACQPIRIIPEAQTPDRGGWRLLDQIFAGRSALLHEAVMQHATGTRPPAPRGPARKATPEREAYDLLQEVPLGVFGKLNTHDRREIEMYRSVRTLLRDYLRQKATRPLSFAVFGPPGAGKSFGVKEVASSLKNQPGCPEVQDVTFNLSLYQTPEELAGAFHLVRDIVLEGKIPLVFFDEFDTALNGEPLGWLRHFLAPMQDGKFLDRGAPHPIGQAIFVFAGGTCGTFREFARHSEEEMPLFRQRKGPDFLSRLRATLDIPSLNIMAARSPVPDESRPSRPLVQPAGTYDPLGAIESLPCEAAIWLRRASILNFNLKNKAPGLVRADGSLGIHPAVLRALLFMPSFAHGNRSFEALLDMSHLGDSDRFYPSMLPATFTLPLHVNPEHFGQLIDVRYPLDSADRDLIASLIHAGFLQHPMKTDPSRPEDDSSAVWRDLRPDLRDSNLGQADDITVKLRSVGLWIRKRPKDRTEAASIEAGHKLLDPFIEELAQNEHDRWCAQKRLQGWIAGADTGRESRVERLLHHNCLFRWEQLSEDQKNQDRDPTGRIPELLARVELEIFQPWAEPDRAHVYRTGGSRGN